MCGYCAEFSYFNALAEKGKESSDPEIIAELKDFQSGKHPYSYIHDLEHIIEIKLSEISDLSLLQLYELYLDKGCDQQLIDQVQKLKTNYKESKEPLFDELLEEYYQESKQYPEIPILLRKLYVIQVLKNESDWNSFMSDKELTTACSELLTHYAKWWLIGGEQSAEISTHEDLKKLGTVLPLLSFALSYLMREQAEHPIITKIAFNGVTRVPFFFAPDLWLQRKAFSHYLLQQGLDSTLKQLIEKGTRIDLLWHVIMTLKLPKHAIDFIVNMLEANPQLYGSDGNTYNYLEKIEAYSI